ncbi:LacI family DNA-binding transcriptional regulator [Arsenicicoccus sp. oral taxon 190]|uniref:LacI family DNA-binding transcriptional regulator n=1 Tax=Arsenicicoccus sp. oral taxon 190 TaxID=1658671 RepID=UPI00067A3341|nr:LacI family DNA-binding transcriptional regulator [Arsenicicoccus sp. oral taxon 190]AKT51597.1 LacI family transcriptional regulator [Arsenicicoccus sp. oral taxon 190]
MATLRDVAQAAGVSPATASRALAGGGSVSHAAKERVAKAAADLGYQVNVLARGLRTQRTHTIGLLLPDVRNPFFTELAYHVDKVAAEHGLTVMIGNADEQTEQQDRYLDVLVRHQVDGIIAVPQGEASEVLRRTAASMPTVFMDRDPGVPGTPTVTSDNRAGMSALVDHLVGLGRRRIGVVAGPQSTSTGRERLLAIVDRLAEHGIELEHDQIVEGDFQLDSGVLATERLLRRAALDAIVAADNLMAMGAFMVLRRHGIQVGVDMALACVDDIEWFELVDPALTVVAQDIAGLGEAAVTSLVHQIDHQPAPSAVVPMRLIARASCGERQPSGIRPEDKEGAHG